MHARLMTDNQKWSGIEGVNLAIPELPHLVGVGLIRLGKVRCDEGTESVTRRLVGQIDPSKRLYGRKHRHERQEHTFLIQESWDYAQVVLIEVPSELSGNIGKFGRIRHAHIPI
jgi:hypothetical protein